MFRVITNLDDPTSIKTFDNYLDILNPLHNPLTQIPTPTQLKTALQVLWNREDILANPQQFFFWAKNHDNPIEVIKKLIAPIPDDHLWYLNYFALHGIADNNKVYYIQNTFRDIQEYGGRYSYFYLNTEYTKTSQYSYQGDNWATEINTLLNNWYNANYSNLLRLTPHKIIHPDCGTPGTFSSRLSYIYTRCLINQPIYITVEGTLIRASQFSNLTANDPSLTLIDLTPDDDYINPQIKVVINKANKGSLCTIMNYTASPTAILQWPLIAKGEHEPTLYGVELELSTEYEPRALIDATDEPFFLIKADSSVTGRLRNRYELATVPMSFKAHKKQWAYWFSNLDYDKFDTSKDTNNGMHVHIGKDTFTDGQHIKNFAWFFTQPAHVEFMKFFSQRDNNSFAHYTPIPNTYGTRVRSFTTTEDRCRDIRGCINFSNKNTIEVRLFRGVVSLADMIKNLEFVDSIFEYTSQGQTFTKLSLKDYINWLHKQPKNKYQIIKKYLEKTTKLRSMIEISEILNLIFTEKSPDKIIKIIDKAGVTVTNEHVTVLNKRWKKRIFILKDGKLILNPGSIAELSFLDRILEKQILYKKENSAVVLATPPLDITVTTPMPRLRRQAPRAAR